MPSKLSPVTIVLRGVDKVTGTVNKISARMRALNKPVRDLSRAFSDLNRNSGFSKVMQKAQGVAASFAQLARRALFVGTALGVVAVAGMRRFISSADALDEAAQAAGISVERLQEVRFAAGRSGIGEGQIDQMMRKFSRTLGEVRRGTGALHGVLKKSNPELLKQFRAVKDTEEGLDLLMRTLRTIPNQALRNVLAVAAVGKGGERITLLADSYDELIDKARELGIVLDRQTVDQAVKAQDALEDLGLIGKGLAMIVGSSLLPAVLDVTNRLTGWINANRELIKTKVAEYARNLAEQIRSIAAWIVDVTPKVISFVDAIGGLKTVLAALAAVILGPALYAIFALSAALLTTPFGQVVLVISVLAAGIYWLTQNFGWLKEKAGEFFGWLGSKALEMAAALEPMLAPFKWLAGFVPGIGGALGAGASLMSVGSNAFSRSAHATGDFTFRFENADPRLQQSRAPAGFDFAFETGRSMVGP